MIDTIILILVVACPAIVLHELAHGWTALRLGDDTAKRQGRLTLNPIKHMDLVGSVIVPGGLYLAYHFGLTKSLVLFGWAKPVPVYFPALKPRRLGMTLVAAAGPLVNLIQAFLWIQLYQAQVLGPWSHVAMWGIMLNLTLAVFNLLPIPPLDGSRIVTSMLPAQAARAYNQLEPFGLIIVVVLLQLGMLEFIYPLVRAAGTLLGIQL